MKENVSRGLTFFDPEDGSILRDFKSLKEIIQAANLQIKEIIDEPNYPQNLVPVKTFLMK